MGNRFSVILPTHNGAGRMETALRSVTSQAYRNYELIVVCDACEDNSAEIAAAYGARVITVDFHRDGLARNAGIEAATGDWILFIDDDDYFIHEHVFDMLDHKISSIDPRTELLFFSFIWKNKGYIVQSYDTCYSMVWCKAWKRSFFDDKRFEDYAYGSDSAFFHTYVTAPERNVEFMDELMYYYNVREGSLSNMDNEKQGAQLDIIITHYNEPWEVGKKLFDSIMMQECLRYESLNIILVQDGKEYALPWSEHLNAYPFRVSVVTMKEHMGVAAARNVGMDHAKTDWVMFMDFDDMFADIASLAMITRLFPVGDEVDVIWSKYVREVNDYGRYKYTTFNCEDEHDYRMIGNIYRRKFLYDHRIRFVNNCPEYCDMIFNSIVFAETYAFKIQNFYAPFYPFFKKLRRDGAFSTLETLDDKVAHQFERNIVLMNEMKRRFKTPQYNVWLIRTLADAYHVIRSTDYEPDDRHGITDDLIMFWREHKKQFLSLSQNDIEVALDDSQTEAMTFIQEYYNYFDKEYYLQNDMISFQDFIAFLDAQETPVHNEPVQEAEPVAEENVPAPQEEKVVPLRKAGSQYGKRAVVYCGTKETYINMIASAKSLLATTPVDRVYFLIEDDEFPYDLPDIIETRNVKNTGLFDPDGPNFHNVWTYMCLMRTAYPGMFPEYDKVLSLDIDVVITEDIGCLWDIDLTDYYFAGVPEEGRIKDGSDDMYANFGVIMMNLDKLRADGLGDKLIEAVNTEHFGCPEQDAFNKYCRGHIYQLPNDYNVTVYSHITGEPLKERILHYAGLKYWKHFGPVKKYYNLSWDEIMKLQERVSNE